MSGFEKRILKMFSVEHIEVDKARKAANLKALGSGRILHHTLDTTVLRGDYEVPVRIFFPNKESKQLCVDGKNSLPVILYIHGGGWVTDGIDNYERISHRLSRYTNHLVISVDYRLAPEYKFPVGLEDCYEVAKHICLGTFSYALHTTDITIMGDSAGGNLSAVICQMCRDKKEFALTRQVLIYPVTDHDYSDRSPYESVHSKGHGYGLTAGRMRDYIDLYKGCDEDMESPYFAPILAVDLTQLPSALIITAENDPLRDEGEAYGHKLQAAGNRVVMRRIAKAIHGYFGMGMNGPFVKETLVAIDGFLKEK